MVDMCYICFLIVSNMLPINVCKNIFEGVSTCTIIYYLLSFVVYTRYMHNIANFIAAISAKPEADFSQKVTST